MGEDEDYVFEIQEANNQLAQLMPLAQELVRLKVDLVRHQTPCEDGVGTSA
jgi:hypothetical protein